MSMASMDPVAAPVARTLRNYLEWGPIVAGAVAAASISFVLLTFGAAVGLSLTSPWPNTGARLWVVAMAVGWWLVAVQIGSFAAGGYLAGRMRSRWGDSVSDEGQFRDGAHGFMVWAVGVLVGGVMLALAGGTALRTAADSATTIAAGAASGMGASAGQGNGFAPIDYATDLLLRPATGSTQGAAPGAGAGENAAREDAALRSEASRIFTASITNQAFAARDRDYLVQVVMQRTGLTQQDATARVDAAMNEARDLEIKAREQAERARKAAVISGFIAAASLLISCVVAVFTAGLGGRHRDEDKSPPYMGHRIW